MTVQEFIDERLRIELDDLSRLKYSDYELCHDINTILRIFNNTCVRYDVSFIDAITTITLTNGVGDLPTNYLSPKYVMDSSFEEIKPLQDYLVVGDKIYSSTQDIINMQYMPTYTTLALTDTIPFPDWVMEQIKYLIVLLAKNQLTQGEQALYSMVESDVKMISARRDVAYIYRDPPFVV